MIPVNSIKISCDVQRLCASWSGNVDCMLYAVSSMGGLFMGGIRPVGCDTPEKWYLTIWDQLSVDFGYAARAARKGRTDDAAEMGRAELWIDQVCEDLRASYGLDDWAGGDDYYV